MSKKSSKKRQPKAEPKKQEVVTTFGYEEILTELEAIVTEAEIRLTEEDAAQ